MSKKQHTCLKKLAGYTQLCYKMGLLSEEESKEIMNHLSQKS
ncbi:hypothetical protein [Alkalihalobacillus sp. CinArs1]|nr:hypothetical protein [Alkalihalobacillus sp. CinArs1]